MILINWCILWRGLCPRALQVSALKNSPEMAKVGIAVLERGSKGSSSSAARLAGKAIVDLKIFFSLFFVGRVSGVGIACGEAQGAVVKPERSQRNQTSGRGALNVQRGPDRFSDASPPGFLYWLET